MMGFEEWHYWNMNSATCEDCSTQKWLEEMHTFEEGDEGGKVNVKCKECHELDLKEGK